MTISVSDFSAWAWKKFENYNPEDMYQKPGLVSRVMTIRDVFRDLLDARKRNGGYLKLGVAVTSEIVTKAVNFNVTSHPYFAYHKAHIEVLADVLNVQANNKDAIEAFNKAVAAADSTKDIDDILKSYQKRIGTFEFQHSSFVDALELADALAAGGSERAAAQRAMREAGITMDELKSAEANLKSWRANWAGIYMEALQLMTMTEIEAGTAAEAMAEFKKILADMMKGSNLSKVGGYATQQQTYWEQYDRMTDRSPKKQPEQAILDPTNYAESKRDDVKGVVAGLVAMCAAAFSPHARNRGKMCQAEAALAHAFNS